MLVIRTGDLLDVFLALRLLLRFERQFELVKLDLPALHLALGALLNLTHLLLVLDHLVCAT